MTFNCVDITHKPKRMQADIKEQVVESTTYTGGEKSNEGIVLFDLPIDGSFITLEKAIDFYEKNALKADIFKNTASWLKDLLVFRKSAIKVAKEKIQAEIVEGEK